MSGENWNEVTYRAALSALNAVSGSESFSTDSGPRSAAAATFDEVLSPTTRGLWISVAGDVKVDMALTGTGIVYPSVPVGYLSGHFTKIYTSGTTATVALVVW